MIDISFEWTRYHSYEITKRGGRKWLQPVGRKADRFEPLKLDAETPLYLRFADLDGSDEGCLQFARYWGLLHTESPTASEMLDTWREHIKEMKAHVALLGGDEPQKPKDGAWRVTALDVLLVPRRATEVGHFSMVLQPKNLFEAMRLQLATGVSSGGSLRACKQCGKWFETGAGDSRRSIAIFCSEKCKNRFHYLERAKR